MSIAFDPDNDSDVERLSLLQAFLETEYHVLEQTPVTVRIGGKYPSLDALPGAAGWAIVTAYNPHATIRSQAQNRVADAMLEQRIRSIQTGHSVKTFHRPKQPGSWPEERGHLFGFDQIDTLHELAVEFNQAGIVVGRHAQAVQLWLYGDHWPAQLPDHVRRCTA